MSSFKDTSNWKQKNRTTLVYPYETKGERGEGSSEMEPKALHLSLERLSFHSDTSWVLREEKKPDSKSGYVVREYISALGALAGSSLHAITLDSAGNDSSDRIFVNIFPVDEGKLTEVSVADVWSFFSKVEKPEDGWLKDEIGFIWYHGASEYHSRSEFSATLFLSNERFNEVAEAVRSNAIRSASLDILADVFYFPYEGSFGLQERYNYAILCTDEGSRKGMSGRTKARLQEVRLEWSPSLVTSTVRERDERSAGDGEQQGYPQAAPSQTIEKAIVQLSRDVTGIRSRFDFVYATALGAAIFLVAQQVYLVFAG